MLNSNCYYFAFVFIGRKIFKANKDDNSTMKIISQQKTPGKSRITDLQDILAPTILLRFLKSQTGVYQDIKVSYFAFGKTVYQLFGKRYLKGHTNLMAVGIGSMNGSNANK